jgi:hypothetical protein
VLSPTETNLSSAKLIIREYSLDKTQLAFTVVQVSESDGNSILHPFDATTAYSDEMIESESDSDVQLSTTTNQASAPSCRVAKYAPKYGFAQSREDMIVVMTQKMEKKKYKGRSCLFKFQSKTKFFFFLAQ